MSVTFRLSALQFLQNAVYASTVISLATYMLTVLDFSGREVGLVYATAAIAATVAPPLTGWLADRHFSLDRMIVWLSAASALFLVGCFSMTEFLPFYGLFLGFNLCFMPTFSLLSSVCFHQLGNPAKEFPYVRMWGTVGFMLIGIGLSVLGWEPTAWPLLAAAGFVVLQAGFALGLDPIPPQSSFGWADLRGEEVRRIIREPGMAILIVAMLLSCLPSAFYYSFVNPFLNEVGWSAAAAKMSLGQLAEFGILLSAPWVLRKLPFRWVVFWGLFIWGARYLAFAYGRPEYWEGLLYAGIVVQGIAFVWIVVAAQIYVDNRVPKGLRSTAQGLISFANQGAGIVIGSWLAGEIVGAYTLTDGSHDWLSIWLFPATIGIVTALVFLWRFPKTGRL